MEKRIVASAHAVAGQDGQNSHHLANGQWWFIDVDTRDGTAYTYCGGNKDVEGCTWCNLDESEVE